MTDATIGYWSTQVDERRWAIGASRRMRCTQTAPQAEFATLARTATMVPAGPAKAVAAGTTQNPLFGEAAQPSSAAWTAGVCAPGRQRGGGKEDPHATGQGRAGRSIVPPR